MTGTGFRRGTRRGGVKKQNGTNTRRGGDIFYQKSLGGGHCQVFQNKKTFYIYQKSLGDIVIIKKRMRKHCFIFIKNSLEKKNLYTKAQTLQKIYVSRISIKSTNLTKNLRFHNLSLTHAAGSCLIPHFYSFQRHTSPRHHRKIERHTVAPITSLFLHQSTKKNLTT